MADQPPPGPAEHAEDFSRRDSGWIDYVVSQRMLDLGIPPEKIGEPDHEHGVRHAAFHPHYRNAGGVSPDGRITVESGVFNPSLMDGLGERASRAWGGARLRHRIDAVIAHEFEESKGGHNYAVEYAPETDLPVGGRVRALLRTIRLSEQGR